MKVDLKVTSCLIAPTPHEILSLNIPEKVDMSVDGELLPYDYGPTVVITTPTVSCTLTVR
jgi:hypothetical protein